MYKLDLKKIVSIFFIVLLCIFLDSCSNRVFEHQIAYLLGVKNTKVEIIFTSESFGGFGEGYTLEVYKISEKTGESFIKKSSKVLPDKNLKGQNWHKSNWQKNPIKKSELKKLEIIFDYRSNSQLTEKIDKIKNLIDKKDKHIFYAYYYKPDSENKDYIEDAELFIIDLSDKKFYALASNI